MDSKTFTENALRTESRPETLNIGPLGLYGLLSLAVVSAELADQLKKVIFYGKELDRELFAAHSIRISDIATIMRHDMMHGQFAADAEHPALDKDVVNKRLLHAAIGMFTEAGEMLEALRKQFETGEFDKVNFGEELGDSDWYKAIAHDELGIGEEMTRAVVIDKLRTRYPGKFTSEAALNRDLEAERSVLEKGHA